MFRILRPIGRAIGLTTTVLALGACGVEFRQGLLQSSFSPGFFQVPAKVDLVMFQDNTGSWVQAMNQVQTELPAFLSDLESGGWDYRFVAGLLVPRPGSSSGLLDLTRPLTEVIASKYDPLWGSLFIAPFPGATLQNSPSVGTTLFRQPEQFTQFVTSTDINTGLNTNEPGFATIDRTLSTSQGVLRPDALTVVLVVGNGNDSSGYPANNYLMEMRDRGDGIMVPIPGEDAGTFAYYQARFQSLVTQGKTAGFKFFSAVAKTQNLGALQNCILSQARYGDRYIRMSQAFGSQSYNLCSGQQEIRSLFTQLKADLKATRLAFTSEYVAIASEPNPATLQVIKYPGGDASRAKQVPVSDTDGYTYEGFQTVHLISSPMPLNEVSAFVIKLSGSFKLEGDDRIEVFYKPVGSE